MKKRPIGIFDSGVGGLSVLRHIRMELPYEDILYVADQANVPYGPRPHSEIQQFSEAITRYLLNQGAKLIVVACNTASAAALAHLRTTFPTTPFVGMEPAIKPGAAITRTGKVGILATPGTFDSQKYASLLLRFADGLQVYENPCVGLVNLIEKGHTNTPQTEDLLRPIITPLITAEVDTLILGCTHYPFVAPIIQQLAGPDVTIIDPAPAVARQAHRVLRQLRQLSHSQQSGTVRLLTTGDRASFAQLSTRLLGETWYTCQVNIALHRDPVN